MKRGKKRNRNKEGEKACCCLQENGGYGDKNELFCAVGEERDRVRECLSVCLCALFSFVFSERSGLQSFYKNWI